VPVESRPRRVGFAKKVAVLDSKESRAFEEVPSTSLAFRADFDAHSGVGCTFSNLPRGVESCQ
jgi:hypothetical protein